MSGLAGFPFQALNQKYLASPSNDAADYGVSIVRAKSLKAYRCIGVYHLTPEQNNRRHHVYIEVLDEQGNRDKSPMLNWTVSTDMPMQSRPLDKPDNEPASDIPMEKWDTVTVRINDGRAGGDSDSVGNLHVRHADEGAQNTWGHHSFFLCFQRQADAIITPPIDPPVPVEPAPATLTLESLAQRVAKLEVDNQLLQKQLIDQGVQVEWLWSAIYTVSD